MFSAAASASKQGGDQKAAMMAAMEEAGAIGKIGGVMSTLGSLTNFGRGHGGGHASHAGGHSGHAHGPDGQCQVHGSHVKNNGAVGSNKMDR